MGAYQLTEFQEVVYNAMKLGLNTKQIRESLKCSEDKVYTALKRLKKFGYVKSENRSRKGYYTYTLTDKVYVPAVRKRSFDIEDSDASLKKLFDMSHVTPDIVTYIKGHYKKYRGKRNELAKKVGLNKFTLNLVLIENDWSCN